MKAYLKRNQNDEQGEMLDLVTEHGGKKIVWATVHFEAFEELGIGHWLEQEGQAILNVTLNDEEQHA